MEFSSQEEERANVAGEAEAQDKYVVGQMRKDSTEQDGIDVEAGMVESGKTIQDKENAEMSGDKSTVQSSGKEKRTEPGGQPSQAEPIPQQQTRRCARFACQNIKIAEKVGELTRKRN